MELTQEGLPEWSFSSALRRLTESDASGICEVGGNGWFITTTTPADEQALPKLVTAFLFAIAMVYTFLGVAIVSDIFMSSIEEITSRKKRIPAPGTHGPITKRRHITCKVWNDTVATLSLMALGSSAPEIFLSLMDLFKKGFRFSTLGPSTIVGSAAFNLFVIVAVCTMIIPSNEVRVIKELPSFYITAIFSIFAYMWLVGILVYSSKNVVTIMEAFATLLFLPLLIWVSYKTDVGEFNCILRRCGLAKEEEEEEEEAEPSGLAKIGFKSENVSIQGSNETQELEIAVKLRGGLGLGPMMVRYRTERFTAEPGYNYEDLEGELEFDEGEKSKTLKLEILPLSASRATRQFFLILEEPEGDVEFDPVEDGGDESAILTVEIIAPETTTCGEQMVRYLDSCISIDCFKRASADWGEKFIGSLFCGGSAEDQKEASWSDMCSHYLALPWNLVFGLVPPTSLFGGWACFVMSLVYIAFLSALLSDLAEMFGCLLSAPSIVTAITFVALGTSMPDLFASLSAAKEDPTADAAIINVTGSNSVNVFLGLGLPWTIGAVYWNVKDGTDFVVNSPNLAFSVMVYIAACCMTLFILYLRRRFLGCELGGPWLPKLATFIAYIGFWLGFIFAVGWRVLRWGYYSNFEMLLVLGGCVCAMCCFSAFPIIAICRCKEVIREDGGDTNQLEDADSHKDEAAAEGNISDNPIRDLPSEGSQTSSKKGQPQLYKSKSSQSLNLATEGNAARSKPRRTTKSIRSTKAAKPSESDTIWNDLCALGIEVRGGGPPWQGSEKAAPKAPLRSLKTSPV